MLSIIVPVLDEARVIESTLAALQPLRAQGAEVIVVDGGSSDETDRVLLLELDADAHGARSHVSRQ